MLEWYYFHDMEEVHKEEKDIFTVYRIFKKKGKGSTKRNHAVLLQWTTYLRAWAAHSTEEASLVNLFANQGFDVYLVDWGNDTPYMERGGTFEDYIQHALDIFDWTLKDSKKSKLHYVGVCEGSVYAQIISSLRNDKIKSLSFNDLILNTENGGITNLLMDMVVNPYFFNTIPVEFYSKMFNYPYFISREFIVYNTTPVMGLFLSGLDAMKKYSKKELINSFLWSYIDIREIQLSHHIKYADTMYSNQIYDSSVEKKKDGEKIPYFEPILPNEGKVKIDLKNIKAPIYNIIGASDSLTEPAESFVESGKQNPFGTPYNEIANEVIPTGHNFWLAIEGCDHIREKWKKWIINKD